MLCHVYCWAVLTTLRSLLLCQVLKLCDASISYLTAQKGKTKKIKFAKWFSEAHGPVSLRRVWIKRVRYLSFCWCYL